MLYCWYDETSGWSGYVVDILCYLVPGKLYSCLAFQFHSAN